MSIQESTIKRLFGMSGNQCAIPECQTPLIINDVVVGEICHIRARRKGGPRFDPQLTAAEREHFDNLILLCSPCHKLADSKPTAYSSDWLKQIKAAHERKAPQPLELSMADAKHALWILAKHVVKTRKAKTLAGNTSIGGGVHSSASRGGVAVAIGGDNKGGIKITVLEGRNSQKGYPANSIGADANMTNYVDYLCALYADYMTTIEPDKNTSMAKIGKHIKGRFRLRTKTRNHLSVERFHDLVRYLIHEKLARTPVGRKHIREGTKLCRTFEEFRNGLM